MHPYEIDHAPLLLRSMPVSQLAILMRLWAGDSVVSIARSRNLHPSTIYRWMHNDARFIAAMNQSAASYMKEINVRTAGVAARAMDGMSEAVDRHDLSACKFMISRMDKLAVGSMSPRVIARGIRRRDKRVKKFLDAQGAPPSKPVITSTIPKPPPAQIPGAVAPAASPPPPDSSSLISPDAPPPAQEPPAPGDA